ncbi:hypothetical protein [Mycobacterium gastri]|uniref:Uncharacterized protein n=1 Tax=Mycobacterium gastri TaxID=1777 RepID=A0A1X1W120_MYCGS|nr:hypothetical protein [Mycobacterium gastri]ETW24006.1 hypothetical protein MGAST_10900 [Mycobacterium gastri 'Wayne']ORV79536.1 hypothetical protein AWC07_22590 [Mycobacterium gastri]
MIGPDLGEPDAAQPMIDWINGAPPAELAAELMAAFDPNVPGSARVLALSEFTDWMFRGFPRRRGLVVPARPVRESLLDRGGRLDTGRTLRARAHDELVGLPAGRPQPGDRFAG